MILDLKRLKKRPHQSERFCLHGRGNDGLLAALGGRFTAPIEVEIEVENTGKIYTGQGTVKTLLQLSCSRCLKEISHAITAELIVTLVEKPGSDQESIDEGFILFTGDEADISPAVDEAIFMAVPLVPLCDEACLGLCPICGQDQNTVKCSCQTDNIDPRWEKLKDLK